MPFRFGASGSVRASRRHQSEWRAPLAHTFWPFTTKWSPSRRAEVRRPARSDPASGSENPWHQISPVEDGRQVAPALLVGAGDQQRRRRVVDRHEGHHQPGASWAASSW